MKNRLWNLLRQGAEKSPEKTENNRQNMENASPDASQAYAARRRKRQYRNAAVFVMACFVVLLTISSLTMDAVTLERIATCGYPDHVHEAACYAMTCTPAEGYEYIHHHNAHCRVDGMPVCSLPEVKAHKHTAECIRDVLVCGYPEDVDPAVHEHTVRCVEQQQVCGYHQHTDACFEDGKLICGKTEQVAHQHTKDCFVLTCRQHVHTDACYQESPKTPAVLPATTEEASQGAVNTGAEATMSEATESEATVAEATASEAAASETAEAKVMIPGATAPEATVSETTEAEATASEAIESEATVSEATESEATVSEATEAEATTSEATESEATVSEATVSEATESEATESEATVSEATAAEATLSEATESEATASEATTSEATESEATASEATASEAEEDLLTYTFTGDEDFLMLAAFLKEKGISVTGIMDAWVEDEEAVELVDYIGDYLVMPKKHFEDVAVHAFDEETEYVIHVRYPVPEAQEIAAEGASVRLPGDFVLPEGTELSLQRGISPELTEEQQGKVDRLLQEMNTDRITWYEISLGDIHEIEAEVTLQDVIPDKELQTAGKSFSAKVVHVKTDGGLDILDGTVNGADVTFTTDGFSAFGVIYTVDFAYEEYTYSIRGGNSILLSDMVKELHISDNDAAFMSRVKNVEFTDPALMRLTYINNPTTVAAVEEYIFDGVFDDAEKEPGSNRKLDEGEWLLTSLAPFKTEEALTITLDSGRQIVITVLDGQEVAGNNFITDAHLTIDGTTYGKDEPWKVYPDVGYTMKLSFAEKGQNQFPAGGDTIVVDLPQGLTLEGNVHHTFAIPAGLAGSITGNEYWVENGKLYVKFGEDPDDILTRSSNAHFDLTFTAEFAEGTTEIPFNGKVTPTIDMDTTADVSVSKSASYNSTTGKMDYTITVKSTGNSKDVQVHDALTNTNLLKIDTGSITVSPGGTEYTVDDSSQGGFNMTIPSIGHNQTVTITYSADVDTSALDHKGNIKVSDDGKNTVTVENNDDDHDDDTNTYTNQIKYSSTSKSSTSMEDHEEEQTATLGWKIVLNDNYRGSIVGDKVWDSIDWSSKDAMKYTVDENGNVTLHIAAKNQDGTKTYNTTVTAAVVTDANGVQSWEYTIPQLGDDPDEILSYEITYTTEVDKTKLDSGSNGIVKNNTTNEGDGSSTGTGVVPIPHGDDPGEDEIVGGKAAVDVTEEYVDWDIVINVPAEGFPDGLTVTDYVPMAPQYGGFADTYDSILSVTGLANGETYTVDCVSTDVDENGNVIWDLRNNNRKRDVVTIEFYQDAQKTTKGLGETGQARTLTIKIRTKNDPEWLAYIEREGSGDSNAYYHKNIAKANNTTFEGKAAPQKSKIYKMLIAGNETADDGMPVYRYAVDLAGVRSLPIVIEDTFNAAELEYYAYWYITDTHQYIDGKSQRHMLNNGISPYKADIVAENGKITITAEDLPRKENGDFWEYYRIYYKLKIKNQDVLDSFTQKAIENGGVYNVRNTATWNGTDDHVDIEFKVPTVEKTGAFRVNQGESGNDRLYDFAIDINKECLELNGGEPMDLTDTHTDNLTVDYTTVKVYKYVGEEKVQDTSIQWNFNGNIGTFYNLQDRTHYVIEYSCLVIGSAKQSFSNYAEMNGYHDEKQDSRDFGTTTEAGADVFQIGLIKFKNGMTSQGLAGATFQLFRGTGSFHEVTNGTDTWMEEDRIPMTWGVGTETAGKVGQNITFTTGEDGYVLIALDQTKHGAELEKGVHYFLKEIESPAGYQIDSSVEYWEFTLTMDPDEVCYGTKRDQYGNRLWIYFYYDDILKMNNTETDQPITVDVDKEWFDIEGNKIENPENLTAKVQLYQKKNNEDYVAVETITNADGTTYNGEITLPIEGSWEYSWEKLPRIDTDGNGYAYKLEEVEVPEDYVSSYTLNETENKKNYHLKNYKVTEREVNVSVSKTWLDEDGKTEIAIQDLPEDLQEVQFYLYRVVSRAPFTTAPTSGGNPYTIDGNHPYLVTGSGAEDGLYKITRDQFQAGISFEELPSVHKDEDGTWYFYSYYVKEVPVDGYSASVDVTETQDEQNNTILLSSMKNRKKPEERTTDLTIEKAWKDKEGGDKSWPSSTVVRFKLYQVTGTNPFDEQPTSGGVLYNVAQVNYNDHPNKVSGEDGLYQMGHTYHGSALYTAQFDDLPEVTIDANEKATYYAYYVDEVEVAGYETAYSYDTSESGKVKVLMTNRQEPDYTQLSVEKKWFDGDNEITDADVLENLSATVELVRYRAVPTGTTVHFTMYNSDVDLASILVPRKQAGVIIRIDSIDGGANAKFTLSFSPEDAFYKVSGDWWGWIQGGTTRTITIPDVPDVYVVFGDGTVNSISVSTTSEASGGPAAIDPTFISSSYLITLNQDNDFSHTYTKLLTSETVGGQTYVYTYGVREVSVPAGFEFKSYNVGTNNTDTSDNKASLPGTGPIIVNNEETEEQTGALKLTKLVTVNGLPTETTAADGDYTFKITGPGEAATVNITITIKVIDGVAEQYKIGDENFISLSSDSKYVTIPNLSVGDYNITETGKNGLELTSVMRGDVKEDGTYESESSPVDLKNSKVTVHVTAGDTTAAQGSAQATFTNNINIGYLKIYKEVTYNGVTPTTDAQKSALAGAYTFNIYTDENCTQAVMDGENVKTLTVTIGADGAAAYSDVIVLPVGEYWIQEQTPQTGVTPDENPLKITVADNNTSEAPGVVSFVNNREDNDNPDELAIELRKTFTGLTDSSEIPSDFKVILTYNEPGFNDPRSVKLTGSTEGHVTCTKSADGMTWQWHVTHIPSNATNFAVSESNYNVNGYTRITKINGSVVENPGNPQTVTVLVPTITMSNATSDYTTTDNNKVFTVADNQILLVRMTNHATVIVSQKSLGIAERTAIESMIHNNGGKIPGTDGANAQWVENYVYFSHEIQGDSFSYVGRTIYFHGNEVRIPHNSSSHEVRVDIGFTSESAENSFTLENDYTSIPITVEIEKIKKDDTSIKLPGAVFTLRQIADSEPGNGGSYPNVTGAETQTSVPTAEGTGKTSFANLSSGYYELKETIAPLGYVLTGETVTYFKISGGVLTWLEKGSGKPSTWQEKQNKEIGELISFKAAVAADPENAVEAQNAVFTVENTPGSVLPNSGGPGTNLIYFLGSMLIMLASAGFILLGRKKRIE